MVLTAPHLRVSADVQRIALFIHLAALVLGFGAVLTLDWSGLMWILRRHDLITLVRIAQVVHTPVWLGLGGLALSGMLLGPDTGSPTDHPQIARGARRGRQRARRGRGAAPVAGPRRPNAAAPLLLTAVLVATVSQAGWWTATVVGFLNAQR